MLTNPHTQYSWQQSYRWDPFTDEELQFEQWKTIPGASGYEVSTLGRVYNRKTGNILAWGYTGTSLLYAYVSVKTDMGNIWSLKVHRAVMMAFNPTVDNAMEIDHIDGNVLNNRLENLRWVTHAENCRARAIKRQKDKKAGVVSARRRRSTRKGYCSRNHKLQTYEGTNRQDCRQCRKAILERNKNYVNLILWPLNDLMREIPRNPDNMLAA